MKLLSIFILLLLALQAQADVDRFNTYQWNRKNVDLGRSVEKNKQWFEWWYYKMVLPDSGESFYFVYGVVNPADHSKKFKGTRAYLGMGDFTEKINFEQEYSIDDFEASYDRTYVRVGDSEATDKHLQGELIDKDGELYRWDIAIHKKWAFNAEGFILGTNMTNIEWYPAQADAVCSGTIESKGKLYHLNEVPCYQDRNWGKSFPNWWVWIVSNHFKGHPHAALAIGGGEPKVWGINFKKSGVGLGLKYKGKVYDFRPNNFDRMKLDISYGKWHVEANDKRYKVIVDAFAPKERFMDLQFMTPNGVVFHDYETLTGNLVVKLYKKKGLFKWELVDTLKSDFGGIEYGSPTTYDSKSLWSQSKTLYLR